MGTPEYMAPEQAAGRPADARTDVYAVGGLLYEMLTGHPPCEGGDAMAVLHKKANEDPPGIRSLRPELPRELERLVARALARAPADRHPSMEAIKDDVLARIAVLEETGAPALARPPERTAPLPPRASPSRRRRLGPGAIAAGIGAGLALLVGLMALRDRAERGALAGDG